MEGHSKAQLISVYRRYGFHLARDDAKQGVLVFTLKTGYFDNAELVKLHSAASTDDIFEEFTGAGYACTVREAVSPEQAERQLFHGFFSAESTRQRLLEDYKRFSDNLVSPYGKSATYTYIKAPYQINGIEGALSPPEEVLNRMNDPEPILFLIEAAAGFGKTCTALEIVKLLAEDYEHLPLYAELSRNRQARIFRYILLDEIDRTFPLLNSNLVQTEIKNGRVAAILDGFDELLRKNEETGGFENKEPMLETVSELLTGSAKVVITTRRTVLFDGDDFHQWLDRHAESFKIIRMRIQEPRVENWLDQSRRDRLTEAGLQIESMANPVLLSYLRCIEQSAFLEAVSRPESIVESYFMYMLERERDRQDLRMNADMQSAILLLLAKDMMELGYTAESRDYIIDYILQTAAKFIDEARSQYAVTDRPSREEIANKLASHALLDRSAHDQSKIGFINEFAFGHYVAANIINTNGWLGDDLRFIDPAVRSFGPRPASTRRKLYDQLYESLPYLDVSSRIEIAASLTNTLPFELRDSEAEGVALERIEIGSSSIQNFVFNECIFRGCTFRLDGLAEVTFLNCKFYDCRVSESPHAGSVYVLGSIGDPDVLTRLSLVIGESTSIDQPDLERKADITVLKKLWPIGESFMNRPSRPIYKPLKFLCAAVDDLSSGAMYESVERLQKAGVLVAKSRSGLITINLDNLAAIQSITKGES